MKIKKRLKTTLAILMALALLVVGSPLMSVSAATSVCRIGMTTYDSLATAISAAADGDVITVTADTTLSSKVTLTKKIEITSNNGSEVTVTVGTAFTLGSGKTAGSTAGELTISGNLKMTTGQSFLFLINYGTLTVKDTAHIKSSTRYVVDSPSTGELPVNINIYGGTIESTSDANDKGTIFFGGTGSTINITGGTLLQHSKDSYAIKMVAKDGTINITGGTVKAVNKTIAIYNPNANKVINISGGTVEATESSTIHMYSKCDYLTVNISENAVLRAPENTLTVSSPMTTVNVSGGTIIATEDAPINMQYGTLNITGGKFVLEGSNASAVLAKSAYNATEFMTGTVNINGGLFINKNTANANVMSDVTPETNPINFNAGKVLYKTNVTKIMEGKLDATKTTQATYDGETYYIYNRFAGAKDNAGVMSDGATVRLVDGSNGMRFVAYFSAETVTALAAKGTVTYGTIIVPVEYLTNLDSFTVEALTTKYGASGFLNIACTENSGVVKNEDGSVQIQAAIVNIKAENYDTAFAAVTYACVGGEYYYTAFDQGANAATIKDVATVALADTAAGYTDAQKTVLNGFVA
ncbi:MAG: hypothetical protein IJZ83_06825 [Clostridia bacterium]|nr:hypothetical protein [Clostridia bacterium]